MKSFNNLQKIIINSINGAYLICAPVGTGKTTVLTERIITALDSDIKPEQILCLTFTNRAAEEMKQRVKERINNKEIADQITIKTFHGFCAYFVKAESKFLGVGSDFVIYDDDEQAEVMHKVLEKYPTYNIDEYNKKRETLNLVERLYKFSVNEFMSKIGCKITKDEIDEELKNIYSDYLTALKDQNALDFNQLVLLTLKGLYEENELKEKWSKRYSFIQLDEFQDTHLAEYLVIKQLARHHKNISFIGDVDQTIYGWRGSDPQVIAKFFKQHFAPVTEYHLETNYRFNPDLLDAIKSFLFNIDDRQTKNIISSKTSDEKNINCIDIFSAYNFSEEISWVIDNIKTIKNNDEEAKIAVLARTNYLIKETANIFSENNIAHITVDKYDFFRRQEVRDMLAYLKIIFNKFDLESAYRIILRPSRSIGSTTIKSIQKEGSEVGLRISDFLTLQHYNYKEPFEDLLQNWDNNRTIVLDTETTGTNILKDDIIQIYVAEVINGKIEREFHHYIKPTKPVGDSYFVHKITDEFLAEKGEDAKKILQELKDFIGNDIVVGHNVNFDLSMIVENAKRNGINIEFKKYYDTLDLSKRLIKSENYKLNTLAKLLNLETATHSADDDVRATIGLLAKLIEKLRQTKNERQILFSKYSKKFIQLSNSISTWQQKAKNMRPKDLLEYIWSDSGLSEYYQSSNDAEKRADTIKILANFFEKRDDEEKEPIEVLQEIIRYTALVKNIDFLGLEKGKIPIVTVHQVKGLEFDYIFIIGMNEYKFPMYKSDTEEEKRLFYVALTRAKNKIFISYSNTDNQNRPLAKSSFIDLINKKYVEFIEV